MSDGIASSSLAATARDDSSVDGERRRRRRRSPDVSVAFASDNADSAGSDNAGSAGSDSDNDAAHDSGDGQPLAAAAAAAALPPPPPKRARHESPQKRVKRVAQLLRRRRHIMHRQRMDAAISIVADLLETERNELANKIDAGDYSVEDGEMRLLISMLTPAEEAVLGGGGGDEFVASLSSEIYELCGCEIEVRRDADAGETVLLVVLNCDDEEDAN